MANTYFNPVMHKDAWRALASEVAQPGRELLAKRVKSEDGTKQLMLYVRAKDAGLKRSWRNISGVTQKRRASLLARWASAADQIAGKARGLGG